MNFWRIGFFSSILLGAQLISSCRTSSPESGGGGQQPKKPATDDPSSVPTGTSNSTSKATDIVVVSAIGAENLSQAQILSNNVSALLSALGQRAVADGNVRVALIASPVATNSGVKASISGSNTTQVNFELDPRGALLGTLVTGCSPSASSLDSSHSPGSVTVCGAAVNIPAHAWAWAVDDLKGKLEAFLRPAANRVYIFIASNDAAMVTSQQFLTIAKAQSKSNSVRVFAITPLAISGICNAQNVAAPTVAALAQQSGGRSYSFCQSDWSSYIAEIQKSL